MDLITKATELAYRAHEGQVRKTDGVPYITHPVAVAEILKQHGFSEVVIAAALVHDVLEDTSVTQAELETELGGDVVSIVKAVSEDKSLVWEVRKEAYIDSVVAASEDVKAISVADKIHNARSLIACYAVHGEATWSKFNRGRAQKIWFERTLCNRLSVVWQHPLLDEYRELVREMEQLA